MFFRQKLILQNSIRASSKEFQMHTLLSLSGTLSVLSHRTQAEHWHDEHRLEPRFGTYKPIPDTCLWWIPDWVSERKETRFGQNLGSPPGNTSAHGPAQATPLPEVSTSQNHPIRATETTEVKTASTNVKKVTACLLRRQLYILIPYEPF